ncbi:hypothetical protein ACFE04_027953 [Oxalis oulophora]
MPSVPLPIVSPTADFHSPISQDTTIIPHNSLPITPSFTTSNPDVVDIVTQTDNVSDPGTPTLRRSSRHSHPFTWLNDFVSNVIASLVPLTFNSPIFPIAPSSLQFTASLQLAMYISIY